MEIMIEMFGLIFFIALLYIIMSFVKALNNMGRPMGHKLKEELSHYFERFDLDIDLYYQKKDLRGCLKNLINSFPKLTYDNYPKKRILSFTEVVNLYKV